MTDYAVYANGRVFAHVKIGQLAANQGTGLADALRRMAVGDIVVPLFQAEPAHGDDEERSLAALAIALELNDLGVLDDYQSIAGTIPFLLTVTGTAEEQSLDGETLIVVPVSAADLPSRLQARDFLRLRALDDTVASQFKGTAPTRPIQEVDGALVDCVRAATLPDRDDSALFRKFTIVAAQNVDSATQALEAADRAPCDGDMAFLVTRATMPGLVAAHATGELGPPTQPIARTPEEIKDLLIDAQRKATPADPFNADPAIEAVEQLIGLLSANDAVKVIDNFATFYVFRLLSRVVTQAIELAKRPLPPEGAVEPSSDPAEHSDAAAALQGLSIEAVLAELPDGFSIERSILAAAVASLRAGKHLLLGGPPGTGKTTLAEALCRAVVGRNYEITTGTADWTTFDTIGGYLPDSRGLKFVPGVVLRSMRKSGWLIIDEVNRADIDKAFGPLFTVLSGGEGSAGRTSVLPYTTPEGNPITIEWASKAIVSESIYTITPSWRLIGTLNISDKASLFRLSFAFLRRFSVIDVPLPSEDEYRQLFVSWFGGLGRKDTQVFVDIAMAIASGPVPIGPAIGRDFVRLIVEGLTETASGTPTFSSDEEAILTATSLLVAPQYEGQPHAAGEKLLAILDGSMPAGDILARAGLARALHDVALS